jgi:glycosyltransferase involved in cell wall biosynthesis
MKVAILYDCMFPYTVGGAERWYVNVAKRLQSEHEITYVTLRQWPAGETPDEPFPVVTVGPQMELYTASGRRKIGPPLRFGWGVFWHLLRHGGRYDIVHGASFPYFSVIGAWAALLFHPKTKLVIDWHEVWTLDYWKGYLGGIGGRVGYAVQQFCARLPDHNFSFSRKHGERLPGKHLTLLTGEYVEGERPAAPAPPAQPPRAVFAGRHIPEKNVTVLPAALAAARRDLPELTMAIYGDGPDRDDLLRELEATGTAAAIDTPGFVDAAVVHEAMASASCMVLPSIREGYGMVVVEALSMGTPAVVVDGPDNAATELIEDGVNGFVAADASPEALGAAIVRAARGGGELRASTWRWYEQNRERLSIGDSIEKISAVYAKLVG